MQAINSRLQRAGRPLPAADSCETQFNCTCRHERVAASIHLHLSASPCLCIHTASGLPLLGGPWALAEGEREGKQEKEKPGGVESDMECGRFITYILTTHLDVRPLPPVGDGGGGGGGGTVLVRRGP